MVKDKILTLKLTVQERNNLRAYASEIGMSPHRFVYKLIGDFIDKKEKEDIEFLESRKNFPL